MGYFWLSTVAWCHFSSSIMLCDVIRCHTMSTFDVAMSTFSLFILHLLWIIFFFDSRSSTYGHDREDNDRIKFRFCKFRLGRFSSFWLIFFRNPDGRISRSGFSFLKVWIAFNWRSRFSTFSILLRLIGFGPFTDRILSGLNRGASKNSN